MKIRAAIFDIYGTLLQVTSPPPDAQARWELIWEDRLKTRPRLNLEQFSAECERAIASEHAEARKRGILHPEVYWPAIVSMVLPEFADLSEIQRSDFRFYHAPMAHTVRLMPGAAEALILLRDLSVRLGLASNSQPYTLRELDLTLSGASLSLTIFEPTLCFCSFQHGFSKPDPHVFRLLTARLRAFGISPVETLVIGDREDNDIIPAQTQGFQTWWLHAARTRDGGDWHELLVYLKSNSR